MMLRSATYLAFVRSHPCCAPGCHSADTEAHHISKRHGGGGAALKPHDTFSVPLCEDDHYKVIHKHGSLPGMSKADTDAFFFRVALQLVTRFWLERLQSRRPGRAAEVF